MYASVSLLTCCLNSTTLFVDRRIEDPFQGERWSLDIDALCAKIERDLLEQVCPESILDGLVAQPGEESLSNAPFLREKPKF